MTIEVISNSREIMNAEEFLSLAGESLREAESFNDSVEFTIVGMHRDKLSMTGTLSVPTVMTLSVNEGETIFINTPLTYDQVADCIDAILEQTGKHKLPSYSVGKLMGMLMDVYNCEHDITRIAQEVRDNVHLDSIFQGLLSKITIRAVGENVNYIGLDVSAELYADTHKQECEVLIQRGLNPENYDLSPHNKCVPLFNMEVESYEKLMGV